MRWNRLNEFEIFNEFEIMRVTLKSFIRTVLRTCKTVSIKPFINREDKIENSQFIYTDIVTTISV